MEELSIKNKLNQVDMLNGKLLGKIMFFALSIALSSVLQQLFNSIDVAVLGHFATSKEQAAVGCNGPVINVLLTLFVGISVGSNVVIANYIGRNSQEKISDTVHTSMLFSVCSGVFLTIFGILIARPILTIMNTPDDVLEYAILYLKLYFLGMPFILVYNFGAAILRSIGDTKRPLYCLLFSGIVNALLNVFLVVVMHWGVVGVAVATVTSNVINAVVITILLMREAGPFQLKFSKLKIHDKELKQILKIGLPAGIQGMVFSLSNLFIQIELNGYGSDFVAGSAVALNFEFFTYFIMSGFNQAAITFTSQNMGARQYDRCKKNI